MSADAVDAGSSSSPERDGSSAARRSVGDATRSIQRENIPGPTVRRLSLYLRELEGRMNGGGTVSSRQLATALGLTDAQVRKDLAYFGQFGQPGIGYQHADLVTALRRILGTDRMWSAIVVGAGNLGRAVTSYGRLGGKGFRVTDVFDVDASVVGTTVGDLQVRPMDELESRLAEQPAAIAMIAVPGAAAQQVTDRLVAIGVRGILNFAPVRLDLPEEIPAVSVDLTVALEQLAYKLALRDEATDDADGDDGVTDDD